MPLGVAFEAEEVFVTGVAGRLGRALLARLPGAKGGDLPAMDITDPVSVRAASAAARPRTVIHCAAWTDVDGCALDPERAMRINAWGTQNVALEAERVGATLMYVSTNEVFDGEAGRPYHEFDEPRPINPYGASKLAGERLVATLCRRFYIVRTAWLLAPGGGSFVSKILDLARQGKPLRVVADEVSSPTLVDDLAEGLLALLNTGRYGIYHLTNEGSCSRYELAQEALRLAGIEEVPIEAIRLTDYSRPSRVPRYTPLANVRAAALGIHLRSWRGALAEAPFW